MTVNENTSTTVMMQIVFWDLVIRLMSTIQSIRRGYWHPQQKRAARKNPLGSIILVMICLALGMYIGVLLGFLGI